MKTINIALFEPEIPPNTGNIARLCVSIGATLHIIGKPAFDISDKAAKRAGLDYWDDLKLHLHKNWEEFLQSLNGQSTIYLISKFGEIIYTKPNYKEGDYLVFGRETKGLPKDIVENHEKNQVLKIPMEEISRSINLSNSAAIVSFEALRQLNGW